MQSLALLGHLVKRVENDSMLPLFDCFHANEASYRLMEMSNKSCMKMNDCFIIAAQF